ncbi:MAG: SRPBCC family protein [Gammaproteobacteria bacterium]
MKKTTFVVSIALFMFSAIAAAHGPVRQKLDEEIQINAAPEKVWELFKDFDNMSWHPDIASVKGEGGNKKGATRVLTLKNGGTISEELKKYNEKAMEYAYKITDMSTTGSITHSGEDVSLPVLPVTNYSASIAVEAKDGGSLVSWKAAFYRGYMNNNPPAELNEDAANTAVSAVLKAGLENLKKLAEQ